MINGSPREREGANNTPRLITRNPDVPGAVFPFEPTKKAAGDVIISTHRVVVVVKGQSR